MIITAILKYIPAKTLHDSSDGVIRVLDPKTVIPRPSQELTQPSFCSRKFHFASSASNSGGGGDKRQVGLDVDQLILEPVKPGSPCGLYDYNRTTLGYA